MTRSSLILLDASKANSWVEPFGSSGTHFQISRMLSTSVSEAWGKKRANALTHGANIFSERCCPQACQKLGVVRASAPHHRVTTNLQETRERANPWREYSFGPILSTSVSEAWGFNRPKLQATPVYKELRSRPHRPHSQHLLLNVETKNTVQARTVRSTLNPKGHVARARWAGYKQRMNARHSATLRVVHSNAACYDARHPKP